MEPNYDPPYMSYFRMPGVLAHPEHLEDLCSAIWEFLHIRLGIPSEDILIRTSEQCEAIFAPWEKFLRRPRIEYDAQPAGYYRWTYGMDGVDGIGYTFAVRDGDETFGDIGNVVAVRSHGQTVAYEFGVGLETMAARMHRLRGPFEAAPISLVIPFSSNQNAKMLQDCLVVVVVLYRQGVRPGRGGARHVLKRVLRGLTRYAEMQQIDDNTLFNWLASFERLTFGPDVKSVSQEIIDAVLSSKRRFEQELCWFEDYVRNQRHLCDVGLITNSQMLRAAMIAKGNQKYALDTDTVLRIINRHF